MRFADNVMEALSCLRMNKMRALLTMLGIIIGITAVIAIMTIGSSMQGYLTETMGELGINNITVSLRSKQDEGMMFGGSFVSFSFISSMKDEDRLTDEILEGRVKEGDSVVVDFESGEFSIRAAP